MILGSLDLLGTAPRRAWAAARVWAAHQVPYMASALLALDPVVVETSVKRMLADGVYPPSVDITADALKVAMDTQIALGNLATQPDYKTFVVKKYIEPALAMK